MPNQAIKKYTPLLQKVIIASADFISIFISFLTAILAVKLFVGPVFDYIPIDQFGARFSIHFILGLGAVMWFWLQLRHYSYRKAYWNELYEILRTVAFLSLLELAFLALTRVETSRYIWLFTWSAALILMPLFRSFAKRLLKSRNMWNRDTFIIGAGTNAFDAYTAITSEPLLGFKINGFLDVAANPLHNNFFITNNLLKNSTALISSGDLILNWHDKNNFQVVIALEHHEAELRDHWLRLLAKAQIRNVFVIPDMRGVPLYGTDMSFFFSHDVLMLRLRNNLARKSSQIIKRTMDIILSLLILFILAIPMLCILLLIAKDGGAPIFGHERIGQGRKRFKCLKFRSMAKDSQKLLEDLLNNDPSAKAEWEIDFKLKNDPRITAIGNFLRRTSLDELPQLFNVLKGQMSLVGPRPVIADELVRFGEDVEYYLLAKPGITGLWQVSGRNDINYEKRVYLDAWYVKNWSLWNDFAILCKTVKVVLKRDGAY